LGILADALAPSIDMLLGEEDAAPTAIARTTTTEPTSQLVLDIRPHSSWLKRLPNRTITAHDGDRGKKFLGTSGDLNRLLTDTLKRIRDAITAVTQDASHGRGLRLPRRSGYR
jgi:hypothetical protein